VLVKLSLVLKRDGRRHGPEGLQVLSMKCPARKPLVDVVRPILHRQLDQSLLDRGHHVVVRLDITGATDEVFWSSLARCFVVSPYSLLG